MMGCPWLALHSHTVSGSSGALTHHSDFYSYLRETVPPGAPQVTSMEIHTVPYWGHLQKKKKNSLLQSQEKATKALGSDRLEQRIAHCPSPHHRIYCCALHFCLVPQASASEDAVMPGAHAEMGMRGLSWKTGWPARILIAEGMTAIPAANLRSLIGVNTVGLEVTTRIPAH